MIWAINSRNLQFLGDMKGTESKHLGHEPNWKQLTNICHLQTEAPEAQAEDFVCKE